jgi:S-DNA-T family DNA segregation ATPase FtsK/SpoIIIE
MVQEHPLRPWLEQQADRIERIGQAHRLAVRVQGGVVTPRLVRFHLALDPRVPLKRLAALEEDLALALSVPSARLTRRDGVLALEVPRPGSATVSLVRLQAGLPPLPPGTALLGRDEEGAPLLLRLTSPEISHVLIAGTTGSGKTALARGMLTSLALVHSPEELRLVLVDPKGRGLAAFAGLPHVVGEVLREEAAVEKRLTWLVEEMAWREESGVRLPRVVVAVDEVADLVAGSAAAGELLTRLATRGREAGLHLLLCTQKPTAEALGTLLRANLPCRVIGRVTSAQEAVVASGIKGTGAERLLGRGDFLLVAGGEVVRFQAGYVSSEEIGVMVEMLRAEVAGPAALPAPAEMPVPARGKIIPFPQKWVERVAQVLAR